MIFECISDEALDCIVGKRYIGEIRNKYAINIKDETKKIHAHDIKKFRIINEEEEEDGRSSK